MELAQANSKNLNLNFDVTNVNPVAVPKIQFELIKEEIFRLLGHSEKKSLLILDNVEDFIVTKNQFLEM